MELYEGDGDDLDENEVNNSDQDSENDETDKKYDPPIDTEVLEVPESPLSDNQYLKLVKELFLKIEDIKSRCSKLLVAMPLKIEGQLKTIARVCVCVVSIVRRGFDTQKKNS